jgi:hypothetical protein
MSGKLQAPAALLRGKDPLYRLDKGLGETQNRSGRREEEKALVPTGVRTPNSEPFSPTITNSVA